MVSAPDAFSGLLDVYRAKAEAEVAEAVCELSGDAMAPSGPVDPSVLVLKGVAGPADVADGRAMAGADSDALDKALAALDIPTDAVLAVITRRRADTEPSAALVATLVEAADPAWVIAVDAEAAVDAAAALRIQRLAFGKPVVHGGRVWLAVDGFEASLSDVARKKDVWAQLRTLAGVRPTGWPVSAGS